MENRKACLLDYFMSCTITPEQMKDNALRSLALEIERAPLGLQHEIENLVRFTLASELKTPNSADSAAQAAG